MNWKRSLIGSLIVGVVLASQAGAGAGPAEGKKEKENVSQLELSMPDTIHDVLSKGVGMYVNLLLRNGTERCGKIKRVTEKLVVMTSGELVQGSCFGRYETIVPKSEILAIDLNQGTIAGIEYKK